MTSCNHSKLILLSSDTKKKLRCRHCHLIISADELGASYCPECFEVNGTKRYNFEEIAVTKESTTQYRCEECGVIIKSN